MLPLLLSYTQDNPTGFYIWKDAKLEPLLPHFELLEEVEDNNVKTLNYKVGVVVYAPHVNARSTVRVFYPPEQDGEMVLGATIHALNLKNVISQTVY